ncbi:glycosyltransferase involved in cell wall biosynthesis [Mucilaginibacter frigoritolerans]|uniref:Glycosyltransferase involved in cell wall biosynthesis n=1 Tax=Mucilaginibacter frigoritolerans TaxID=652788 RepID=A0A562U5V5_9SPHI|nr:glycosyltransferase [Mucilaginibacter frigoritolerans]TWJ00795.1 glycosyltransferase involved in cell wall biosynthesis [Mucilaginibacter frigoritolerans]
MKKAIIFYPHIGEYGGIERNIIALASEIIRNGHIPVLVCFYDHINMPGYLDQLITVEIKDHWNPLVKSLRLKRWLKQNKNELLGLPFFMGGKAGFYGAFFNNNYILHYTDPPSLLSPSVPKSALKNWIATLRSHISNFITFNGVSRAKVCLTMTNWNTKELESLYRRKFGVIYQGGLPPTRSINQSPRFNGKILRIFSISRLNTSKNLDWILETAQYLVKNSKIGFEDVEVVIAGNGPQMNYLQTLSKEMGLEKNVSFPGFLTTEQVEDQYSKCDLFLVPARQGYGLPVLEALYRHVPVVINVESHISEMFTNNPWVLISDNTVDDFRNKVLNHIFKIKEQYPDNSYIKNLPTEQDWAFQIGQQCNWW